eukprot:Nk52_evm74s1737 gene=Nk52_evmTU74s1737
MSTKQNGVKVQTLKHIEVVAGSKIEPPGVSGSEEGFEKRRLPLWQLFLIATPWLGVQAVWSLEYGLTGTYLSDVLGMPKSYAVLVFILGPITGMTVGPMVGALSDNWTGPYGRRRPFVAFGIIVISIASMLFANALDICGQNKTAALVIAFLSFGIMDAFMNVLQGPLRAILADLACPDQQEMSQAFASFFQGLGMVGGYLLVPYLGGVDYIVYNFLVALGAMYIFSIPVFVFGKEVPYVGNSDLGKRTLALDAMKSLYKGLLKMPADMIKICVTQFFCWLTWMCFQTVTLYYCQNILYGADDLPDGDHKDDVKDDGASFNGKVNAYVGVVQLVTSFCMVFLMKYLPDRVYLTSDKKDGWFSAIVPPKLAYVISLSPFAFVWYLIYFNTSKGFYTAMTCIAGISYAGMNVFPFAFTGRIFPSGQVGTMIGLLNIFICIPQIIANFGVSGIMDGADEQTVFLFAGTSGLLAFLTSFAVRATRPPEISTTAQGFVDYTSKDNLYENAVDPKH